MDRLDTETLWENRTRKELSDAWNGGGNWYWVDISNYTVVHAANMSATHGRTYWDMAAENEEEGWYD